MRCQRGGETTSAVASCTSVEHDTYIGEVEKAQSLGLLDRALE